MNIVFEWYFRPEPPERPMYRILYKVPFEKQVITERGECWGYEIVDKKPKYYFLFAFMKMANDYKATQRQLTKQEDKSIKRHINKLKRLIKK